MENSDLNEISEKLDLLIGLIAQQVAKEHDTLGTKAVALSLAGLGPKQIASICGTTAASVSVQLAKAKRNGRRK